MAPRSTIGNVPLMIASGILLLLSVAVCQWHEKELPPAGTDTVKPNNPNCYSDPPEALRFHEAILDCSQSGGIMAYINTSLFPAYDPIKALFTRWYSTNRTVNKVWLVVASSPKDQRSSNWEYVYVDLQMNYVKDRSYAITQVMNSYGEGGTRSSFVTSSINSSTIASYSCISNQCIKSLKKCPSPFILHANGCYYVANATTSTYVTPTDQCLLAGGVLVPTESTIEQAFMATLLNSMDIGSAYVGAIKDFASTSWTYIIGGEVSTSVVKRLNANKTAGLRCAALEVRSKEFVWTNVDCVSPLNALCIAQDPPCPLQELTNVAGKCAYNPQRGARCQPPKSTKVSMCQPGTTLFTFPPSATSLVAPLFKSMSCLTDPCDDITFAKTVEVCVCSKCACPSTENKPVVHLRTALRTWRQLVIVSLAVTL